MIALIENLLIALSDAQFDKLLVMFEQGFKTLGAWIEAGSKLFIPLIVTWVAWKCKEITLNQKANREALDENTKLTEESITTSNGYNAKIAASLQEIADLKKQIEQAKK